MTRFLTAKALRTIVKLSPSFDDFLQNVANYVIVRFLPTGFNPPEGKIEELLNAIIASGFETEHYNLLREVL